MRVCLVSGDQVGAQDGIDSAFKELAMLLAKNDVQVDLLHCPTTPLSRPARQVVVAELRAVNIEVGFLRCDRFVSGPGSAEKRSYAAFRHLFELDGKYDVVHFPDYGGLAYFSVSAKRQGLAFQNTNLVIHLGGPSKWVLETGSALPTRPDQLKTDFIEKESIRLADEVVSPSRYLIGWMSKNGFQFPPSENVRVLKDVCTALVERMSAHLPENESAEDGRLEIDEIVFFADQDEINGLVTFCDALDTLEEKLVASDVRVTFLGKFCDVNGEVSGILLARRAVKWCFPISVYPDYDLDESASYLARRPGSIVIIPRAEDSSSPSVISAIALRKRLIASSRGGTRELIGESQHSQLLYDATREGLASKIGTALTEGVPFPVAAEPPQKAEDKWLEFHEEMQKSLRVVTKSTPTAGGDRPRVVLGITHYERPAKLIDAVMSAINQTYSNLQIVVVDDGSVAADSVAALSEVEAILKRAGGFLIRKENAYLGAARNAVVQATESDYICFLDDDDIAFPDLIEKLVMSATHSGADVMSCMNIFMRESRRVEAWPDPATFCGKVSYVPTGGPLALAPIENCIGAATALIRRDFISRVGGYTELRGVGHEDYELYVRMLQAGAKVEVCPLVLYLYEVDRPSMINSTSSVQNFKRVADSIKFDLNTAAWRDFVRLQAGRTAVERQADRRAREDRRSMHGAILERISDPARTTQARLLDLAEYASVLGARTMGQAFAEAARGPDCPAEKPSNMGSSVHAPREGAQDHSLSMKVDLGMGRFAKVANHLEYIARTRSNLADQEWRILEVMLHRHGEYIDWLSLRAALSSVVMSQAQVLFTLPPLFLLSLGLKDLTAARALFDEGLHADETDYLKRYRDVARAIEAKKMPSGLYHYQHWGFAEGRVGFPILSRISALTEAGAFPWELEDALPALRFSGGVRPVSSRR